MTNEKREMNLTLVNLTIEQFDLAMCDRWSSDDYTRDREITLEINKLYKEYEEKFNEKPLVNNCNYITEVYALKKELSA